jgi:hypothetical protein
MKDGYWGRSCFFSNFFCPYAAGRECFAGVRPENDGNRGQLYPYAGDGHRISGFCYDERNNRTVMSLDDGMQFAFLPLAEVSGEW